MPKLLYDVFLSHNSEDKAAVEQLARRLKEETDLNPFLDRWHLIPGEPWMEALEEALDQSATVAVFVGPSGISPWHNEEMCAALQEHVGSKLRRVIPVLLPGSSSPRKDSLPGFLRRRTWVDFRSGLADADAFHRLLCGIEGQEPGPGQATKPAPNKLDTPHKPSLGNQKTSLNPIWPKNWLIIAIPCLLLILGFWLFVWPKVKHSAPIGLLDKRAQTYLTIALEDTPVPTAANTSTQAPMETLTRTPTPSPAPTHTATRPPTETPTKTPTHTPTPPPSPTHTATHTPTHTPWPTPTPRWLPAPQLIAPRDGAQFLGWNNKVKLEWSAVAGRREDEYYVVRIPYSGGIGEFWCTKTFLHVPDDYYGGEYNWTVQTMRCTKHCTHISNYKFNKEGTPVGSKSLPRQFHWRSDAGGGTKAPTPTPTPHT